MEKSLKFPQEVEIWYILPAIRRKFALEFVNAGMSQKKAAEVLGVTEAAISQYKKQKRANIEFEEHVKKQIKEAAARVLANPQLLFQEIMAIDQYVKHTGEFCRIHKLKTKTHDGCDSVCKKHYLGVHDG